MRDLFIRLFPRVDRHRALWPLLENQQLGLDRFGDTDVNEFQREQSFPCNNKMLDHGHPRSSFQTQILLNATEIAFKNVLRSYHIHERHKYEWDLTHWIVIRDICLSFSFRNFVSLVLKYYVIIKYLENVGSGTIR